MNGEGRQTEGGTDTPDDDNVVRLPRDWLGPPEDLIPIGPRAETHRQEERATPSASDFWGETSASLQDALAVPHAGEDPHRGPISVPRPGRHRSRAAARDLWSRRRAWAAGAGLVTRAHDEARPGRVVVLGSLSALAGALLVLVLMLTAGTASKPRIGSHYASAVGAGPRRGSSAGSKILDRPKAQHGERAGSRLGRVNRSRGRGVRTRAVRPTGPVTGAAAEPVGYTTPANATTGATSSAGSTPVSASTSTPQPSPSTSSTAQHSASSTPAFGANGSLGPGSSPDG